MYFFFLAKQTLNIIIYLQTIRTWTNKRLNLLIIFFREIIFGFFSIFRIYIFLHLYECFIITCVHSSVFSQLSFHITFYIQIHYPLYYWTWTNKRLNLLIIFLEKLFLDFFSIFTIYIFLYLYECFIITCVHSSVFSQLSFQIIFYIQIHYPLYYFNLFYFIFCSHERVCDILCFVLSIFLLCPNSGFWTVN